MLIYNFFKFFYKYFNGFAELAKPMYDKKMWNDDGTWIQPPTFRVVADIVLDIVGNVTGHKWIGYVNAGEKFPDFAGLKFPLSGKTILQ